MSNPSRAAGIKSEMPPVSGSILPLGIVLFMRPSLGDVVLSPAVVGQGLEAVISAVVAVVVLPVVVPVVVPAVVPVVVVVPIVVVVPEVVPVVPSLAATQRRTVWRGSPAVDPACAKVKVPSVA